MRRPSVSSLCGPGRARGPFVAALLGLVVASGCKRDAKIWVPTVAASGPTENCPRDRMTAPPGSYPSPDDIRCSYAKDVGARNSRLHGTVFGEQPGTYPGVPLEGVTVTLHDVKQGAPTKERARASSDPQGHFRFAVILEPAEYMLTARNEQGEILARRFVEVSADGAELRDLQLLIPIDPELKAAMRANEGGGDEAATGSDDEVENRPAPASGSPSSSSPESAGSPTREDADGASPLPLGPRPR